MDTDEQLGSLTKSNAVQLYPCDGRGGYRGRVDGVTSLLTDAD